MFYNVLDIYIKFKDAEFSFKQLNKKLPTKIPKNLSKINYKILEDITMYFNTKWCNIIPEKYFYIGFGLWKTFSYKYFLHRNVIEEYIRFDKSQKLSQTLTQEDIIENIQYMQTFCVEYKGSIFRAYANLWNGKSHKIIDDYIKGYINRYIIGYMIYFSYIHFDPYEKEQLPIIFNNLDDIIQVVKDNISILKQIDKKYLKG